MESSTRRLLGWLLGCWLTGALLALDAPLLLINTSVSVHPATNRVSSAVYSFALSAFNDGTMNDELSFSVSDTEPYSHFAYGYLTTPDGVTTVGSVYWNVPDTGDVNTNAINDFMEVQIGATNVNSEGSITFDDGMSVTRGTIETVWNRFAGSTAGVVKIHLKIPDLAFDQSFSNGFEIYDYAGILTYVPTLEGADASVNLTRVGGVETIRGPLQLIRTNANELGFTTNHWTNTIAGTNYQLLLNSSDAIGVSITRGALNRYLGLVAFDNGLPTLPIDQQYQIAWVQISDPNDINHNGIADLSDDALFPQPTGAQLGIALSGTTLSLTITPSPGQTLVIEASPSLTDAAWKQIQEIPPSTNSQTLSFPFPTNTMLFYRAR